MRIAGKRIRLTGEHMELMRIPRRFWESSASGIQGPTRDKLVAYMRDMDSFLDEGVGLLIWGKNGVGKTGAAVALAKEARRLGASVLFTTAEGLRGSVLEKAEFDGAPFIERARYVDVLVLDDLGKEHAGQTGFTERLLEDLIRKRSSEMRCTIITSNMGIAALRERYKPSMLEVMKETVYPIRMDGESRRDGVLDDMFERLSTG